MVSDTVEILMWVAVYCTFMAVGYLFGRVKNYTARNDLKAKADMAEAKATHFEQLSEQSTAELLELQEDYQNLYRRDTKLRDGVKAHRAANNSNCNDLSCEKGCGHDLRLYKVLDETDVSVAGLFPSVDVNRKGIVFGGHQSIWDKVREGLPETEVDDEFDPYHTEPWLGEVPESELPGMWERADFEGGQEPEVRGPDWTPEQATNGGWPEVTD